MRVIDHLNNAKGRCLFSFEILPPVKGKSIDSIYEGINPLIEFKPNFINVTYHREEYIYKKREGGYLEKVAIRKRPGTVGICAAIINKYGIDPVPHLICGGFSREETENALLDLHYVGIDNVLALRGDAIKTETVFVPEQGGNRNASELVEQTVKLNSGQFLSGESFDPLVNPFCIGVAGYPEKHSEAPNMQTDLAYLKKKVDAGADYVVTQMFYDNALFFEFVKASREMGITVPIIPGLKPVVSKKQLLVLPKIFNIDIPYDLFKAMEAAKDDDAARQVGIEWCIAQSRELKEAGVPCLHYYTMGKSEAVKSICKAIF